MTVIKSTLKPRAKDFKENAAALVELVSDLREKTETASLGGSQASRERHVARGKLLARERVRALCDPGGPFLELSPLAAYDMYEDNIASAGIVTGVGVVSGTECVIVANDATVKGGTYYPMTVKKHLRAQEVARENNLPQRVAGRMSWTPDTTSLHYLFGEHSMA